MSILYGLIHGLRITMFGVSTLFLAIFIYLFIKKPIFECHCQYVKDQFPSTGPAIARVLPFLLLIVILTHPVTMQLFGYKNLELLDDGYYTFYVERNGRIYPALIEVEEESEEKRHWIEYHAIAIDYGVNVSHLEYDDEESLVIGKECWVWPEGKDFEEGYYITLLNKPAYSLALKETNNYTAFQIISLLMEITSIVLFYLMLTMDYEKRSIKRTIHAFAENVKQKYPSPIDFWMRYDKLIYSITEKSIKINLGESGKKIDEYAIRMLLDASKEYLSGDKCYSYFGEMNDRGKELLQIIEYSVNKLVCENYMTEAEKDEYLKTIKEELEQK